MSRKPLFEKPMTSAERMRRSREKKRAAETPNIKSLLRETARLKKKIAALELELQGGDLLAK